MAKDPAAKRGKTRPKLLRPGMLMLAAVFIWSAQHQPPVFTPASLSGWALGAATVALLTRATLALAAPVLGIFGTIFTQALQHLQHGAES
ncbi:hypothetical protein GCM10010909_21930 [Acidocella aquatica]|uniref:Uncharacterized protein n=1 Tax=Acidocella aquatica TaxID=1922313 RepID=A0ABQ6A897_9PROT|nr:hypothetical protein [Acidocella aquatica]GLR67512.1 hypothetical protein GCM10010909_21930 [Acidocella aquatica]